MAVAAGDPDAYVRVLLVRGPHAAAIHAAALGPSGETLLAPLSARVVRIEAESERETLAALAVPCEAVVLDPGTLEHFSVLTAEAVERLDVPVIVARQRQEHELGRMGAHRRVSPVATASVSGGGAVAYEGAVEAAAWLAWERRRASR